MTQGVLMMAYGGPDSLEDVEPYLLDVRAGRPSPPAFVEEVRHRYELIGGRSPLLDRTREQAEALQRELRIPVYVGMRHWRPFITDVLPAMISQGIDDVVALPMAPHFSPATTGAYERKVEEARERTKGDIAVQFVRGFSDEPLFLEAVATQVGTALGNMPAETIVVFTAHSLPLSAVKNDDRYEQACVRSAEEVAARVSIPKWRWAFQSQGRTGEGWLGPDLRSTIDELSAEGHRHVLIVPIGFVCDHVEILYDLDIDAKEYASRKGVQLQRTASLNDAPQFIAALANVVRKVQAS